MNVKKIVSIIIVIIWMSIIFGFSNQKGEGSKQTSGKMSQMIIRLIDIQHKYSDIEKEELIEKIEPLLRKIAHFSIYTIGGIIITNCVWQFCNKEKVMIGISACIGTLYAISDEVHQLMVNGRSGNVKDVAIDSIGVITGIMVFLLIIKIYKKLIGKKQTSRGGEEIEHGTI